MSSIQASFILPKEDFSCDSHFKLTLLCKVYREEKYIYSFLLHLQNINFAASLVFIWKGIMYFCATGDILDNPVSFILSCWEFEAFQYFDKTKKDIISSRKHEDEEEFLFFVYTFSHLPIYKFDSHLTFSPSISSKIVSPFHYTIHLYMICTCATSKLLYGVQ